jgi:hypothetical protein
MGESTYSLRGTPSTPLVALKTKEPRKPKSHHGPPGHLPNCRRSGPLAKHAAETGPAMPLWPQHSA